MSGETLPPSAHPLNVLQVIGQMNRAGAETLVMNLLRHSDPRRVRFDFVVHTAEVGDYDSEIRALGGRIFVAPRFTGINARSYRRWWDRFFRQHPEIDLVHGHIASSARIYLAAAKTAQIPTIAHSHNTDGKTRKFDLEYYLFRMLTRGTADVADHLMGCSAAALIARYGTDALTEDSFVVNNGVDTRVFRRDEKAGARVRSRLGIPEGALVFGTIGRLTEVKNPDFTLDVISAVVARRPDAHFVWVGRGELSTHIEGQVARRHLSNHVHLLGVRSDIPHILNALDVFVMCSKYEGLPVVLVEAQACGVPVVVSDAVTPDALLTRRSRRIGITDHDITAWVNAVIDEAADGRFDGVPEIQDAGFDIDSVVRDLSSRYEKFAISKAEPCC